MLPWKAIQSEEKTAHFISLVAILQVIKLFSCTHVINKDGIFPCNKDEAKKALTHFCSTPRVLQVLFDANQKEHGYCVLMVPWAYILYFSASHLAEMKKPWLLFSFSIFKVCLNKNISPFYFLSILHIIRVKHCCEVVFLYSGLFCDLSKLVSYLSEVNVVIDKLNFCFTSKLKFVFKPPTLFELLCDM